MSNEGSIPGSGGGGIPSGSGGWIGGGGGGGGPFLFGGNVGAGLPSFKEISARLEAETSGHGANYSSTNQGNSSPSPPPPPLVEAAPELHANQSKGAARQWRFWLIVIVIAIFLSVLSYLAQSS